MRMAKTKSTLWCLGRSILDGELQLSCLGPLVHNFVDSVYNV